jgi:hypothetical protein
MPIDPGTHYSFCSEKRLCSLQLWMDYAGGEYRILEYQPQLKLAR